MKNKMEWIKARKKPIVIEAMELTEEYDDSIMSVIVSSSRRNSKQKIVPFEFEVMTMEGPMRGHVGDYLMKGVEGELYICARDIFKKTYEVLE